MYTIIVLPGGRQLDALLLSAAPARLRVVIPGRSDTTELQRIEGKWTSENGIAVELGAIIAGDAADVTRVLANSCRSMPAAV